MRKIAAILLAAGASSRLGSPKQLLPFHGKTLIEHSINVALEAACNPIIVVLGSHKENILSIIKDLPLIILENYHWEEGIASSIRLGVQEALKVPDLDAAVLLLSDQPFVSAKLIKEIIEQYSFFNSPIVASCYANIIGVPALFNKALLPQLLELKGDQGARKLIDVHRDEVRSVAFPHGDIDIDTKEDYQKIVLADF